MHLSPAFARAIATALGLFVALLIAPASQAQTTTAPAKTGAVVEQQTRADVAARNALGLDARDLLMGQIWGLSQEEMARAKVLLQGPRASFSVANLSPIEALGIHARNDAERRKYAEMMARMVEEDVKRSLAWNSAYQEAMVRLYGVQPIVDYSNLPKVVAPVGSADAAHVPRTLVIDPAPSAHGDKRATQGRAP
jgi:hypothetical protein